MTPLAGDGISGRQVDVVLPAPVGRICRAWGTRDRKKRAERKQLLFDLKDYGQTETLIAFRDGERSWTDLLSAKRTGKLAAASLSSDLLLDRKLFATIEKTLPKMGRTTQTRTRYASALMVLQYEGVRRVLDTLTVADLATFDWEAIWTERMKAHSPASRNRVKSAVSAFLSVFLGDKYHPFRRQIMKAMGTKEDERHGVPRTISLKEFWKIVEHVPEPIVPVVLTLAATGMRVAEYLQCGPEHLRHFPSIEIPGGKSGEGIVQVAKWMEPYVRQAIPCSLGPAPKYEPGKYPGVQFDRRYKVLYREVTAAAEKVGLPCSPHYLRHLFGAMAVAGTDQVQAQTALRHKTAGMTAHYAKQKTQQGVADAVGRKLRKGVRDFVRGRTRKKGKRGQSRATQPTARASRSK